MTDKQITEEVDKVRSTIKKFNDDLNTIMERNQGYIYKMEKQQPQQKPIEDVMKGLDLARENNIKILQTLQADIKTVIFFVNLAPKKE